jgi:hypothetical protein
MAHVIDTGSVSSLLEAYELAHACRRRSSQKTTPHKVITQAAFQMVLLEMAMERDLAVDVLPEGWARCT